jgi:spore coat polysaccharide biosynthesis protein SpsF
MNVVAIIQARMNSTRLPGKVLLPLAGRPMLGCQIERMRRSTVNEIVIATTTSSSDDGVVELARQERVGCFRGSEADVLSRYVGAARQYRADVVVRVTADCPLLDGEVLDRVVRDLLDNVSTCDYAANLLDRTYPRGLDVEAFFFDTLLRIDRLALSQASREHVTIVPRSERPERFLIRSVRDSEDNSDLRWTVDTREDFDAVRGLYDALNLAAEPVPYRRILQFVRTHPQYCRLDTEEKTWDPMRRAG